MLTSNEVILPAGTGGGVEASMLSEGRAAGPRSGGSRIGNASPVGGNPAANYTVKRSTKHRLALRFASMATRASVGRTFSPKPPTIRLRASRAETRLRETSGPFFGHEAGMEPACFDA